jgi:glutamate/tyrosine decarboxylase-like PLP-dependent enzyme
MLPTTNRTRSRSQPKSTRSDADRVSADYSTHLTVAEHPMMVDFMDYGPRLSRGFKALKVWRALQAFGTDAFRAAVDQTLELARSRGHCVARTCLR